MDYDVTKAFQTHIRRFAPGQGPGAVVSDGEDVSPFTIATLEAGGFVKAKVSLTPALAPSPTASKGDDDK